MTEQALEQRGRLFRCLSLMLNCVELLLQFLQEIDDDDELTSCALPSGASYANITCQNQGVNPLVPLDMATSNSKEEMISLDPRNSRDAMRNSPPLVVPEPHAKCSSGPRAIVASHGESGACAQNQSC